MTELANWFIFSLLYNIQYLLFFLTMFFIVIFCFFNRLKWNLKIVLLFSFNSILFMIISNSSSAPNREFFYAIFIPILIGLAMLLSFILEKGMDWDFHSAAVYPRHLNGLWGIFTIVFIHADLDHLLNNLLSFMILSTFLFLFYKQIAWNVLWISYLSSGLFLWD